MNAGINNSNMFSFEEPVKTDGKSGKIRRSGSAAGAKAAAGTDGPFFQDLRAAVREVYDCALLSD
ncbi:MAG: hypothetical protein JXR25_17750 [Pontiellaceae bacterium]|nr:hypothetical protein [Pontiellaceae bacterium]MBN2786666.1 hypothetical protein [Pontiellaceae bacterium]